MSTTVTFAGNVAEDPELLHTRDNKPFVTCRVVVGRRKQDEAGEWVDGEPTGHNVKVFGPAAHHFYDSVGRGDRVIVHGLLHTENWRDRESGEKHTKQVVVVDGRFGEVGASFRFAAARIEHRHQTAPTAG